MRAEQRRFALIRKIFRVRSCQCAFPVRLNAFVSFPLRKSLFQRFSLHCIKTRILISDQIKPGQRIEQTVVLKPVGHVIRDPQHLGRRVAHRYANVG